MYIITLKFLQMNIKQKLLSFEWITFLNFRLLANIKNFNVCNTGTESSVFDFLQKIILTTFFTNNYVMLRIVTNSYKVTLPNFW